jgi:hypothetical protein
MRAFIAFLLLASSMSFAAEDAAEEKIIRWRMPNVSLWGIDVDESVESTDGVTSVKREVLKSYIFTYEANCNDLDAKLVRIENGDKLLIGFTISYDFMNRCQNHEPQTTKTISFKANEGDKVDFDTIDQ